MIEWLHPAVILIPGAFLIPFLRGWLRKAYIVALPTAALMAVAYMTAGNHWTVHFIGYDLVFGRADKLSIVFGWVFTIAAIISAIYALHVDDDGQHVSAFLYVGGSLGVVFAGDYFTLFIFWELMAFASAYLVFAKREDQASKAGFRYILVHTAGGVILLGGIILHVVATHSIVFQQLPKDGSLAFYMILTGFMLNAAVPPLHAWLADAYPEATVTGAVFMSAFTTKTAVYVLVRGFAGTEILIWLGTIMALYGVVYAVLENDCRRLLAYHIISQVGYMVAGVGIGTEMTLDGAVSHAFAHILYKGLLFMGAGAVIHMTGKRKLTELGGLYKTMPITLVLYMVGGFAISAFPLFSGFVTKTMVIAGAAEDHYQIVALLLIMAGAGTFLHTGLKLPYYMFFGKDSGIRAKEPPLNMLIAMGLGAALCIGIGVFPGPLYHLMPYPVTFHPYAAAHVTGELGLLLFTGLGFFMLLKKLDPEPTISMDTDWFYRKGALVFMWVARKPLAAYEAYLSEIYNAWFTAGILKTAYFLSTIFDRHVIDGLVNGVANFFMSTGGSLRRTQSGLVRNYALTMLVGSMILVGFYLIA
jgi:multicomponent Na+:H+ antiporter subunit D